MDAPPTHDETTAELANWDVRTYLGIVTAEVAVEAHGGDFKQLGATLTRAREIGTEGLIEEAITRGAHAVVGGGRNRRRQSCQIKRQTIFRNLDILQCHYWCQRP